MMIFFIQAISFIFLLSYFIALIPRAFSSYGLWQLKQVLFLKKQQLLNKQSKNADINATIPSIIAKITNVKLDRIIATNSAIEKNINPTNNGQRTNLLINIANTIVTSITAKKISIFIYIILSR